MTIKWVTAVGKIADLIERIRPSNLYVEAFSTNNAPISFSLISGKLPQGLKLGEVEVVDSVYRQYIIGTPGEVRKITDSRFVIRANDGTDLEDRTFSLTVVGYDAPEWVTPEGFLPVGINDTEYVLDNTYLTYQLEAYDSDQTAGDQLEYFLVPLAGQLPPGISLTKDGVISGYVDPINALEFNDDLGGYDVWNYDLIPYDFVQGYGYDDDPRKLSRIYSFVIGVTDGVNTVNRLFKIFVVTEDFLKRNQLLDIGDYDYRRPVWVTSPTLGRYRANNYITIFLDVYDPQSLSGTLGYYLLPTNRETEATVIGTSYDDSTSVVDIESLGIPQVGDYLDLERPYKILDVDLLGEGQNEKTQYRLTLIAPLEHELFPGRIVNFGSLSVVPPNLFIDNTTGELAGLSPYQSRITKSYKFTVMAVNFPIKESEEFTIKGQWFDEINYQPNDVVFYQNFAYFYRSDAVDNDIENEDSWTKLTALTNRTFTIDMIGEIESGIQWVTNSNLGTIKPNQSSMISVEAISLLYGGQVFYKLINGSLPPGLTLQGSGDIVGKVKQFPNEAGPGLTRFFDTIDDNIVYDVQFDQGTTTFDYTFRFTIEASDAVNFIKFPKDFVLTVSIPSRTTYCDLYAKGFLSKDRRATWSKFINDSTIFQYDDIYRYGDVNFGVQNELKVLIYAGIENVDAVRYVQAISRNHYRKRLLFGDIKTAKAKDPITQKTLYEVVYIDVVDEYEKNGTSISSTVELPNYINSKVLINYNSIKADSDIPFASDSDHQRVFPNSIKNMRKRISLAGERDRTFLPLWMRSIQDVGRYEPGYTKALVLCYTKPGRAEITVSRIKASGFDFKLLDFVADRYLIDVPAGEQEDKYLAFPQRGEKLP